METLGKLEIFALCLPLIGSVMETVGEKGSDWAWAICGLFTGWVALKGCA